MKQSTPLFALLILLTASLTQAQMKNRLDLFEDQYQQDRARSLTQLNEKYIAQYAKELETASQARNLEDVKRLSTRIEELKAEITKIADASGGKVSPPGTTPEKDLLIGKSVYFTHPNGKDEIWVEFGEDHAAVWVGLGQVADETWRWERAAPDLINFWHPSRPKEQGGVLKLDEDAKGGTVTMSRKDSKATIRRTARR
ncbi:MAG: hypothetical protein KBF76_09015 [Verrucomicrobiales bacterium]|nr:hypothetical protein [Verrucomicrobiales bacterium]